MATFQQEAMPNLVFVKVGDLPLSAKAMEWVSAHLMCLHFKKSDISESSSR